jgi:trimethylamine---corrinoid protein Co-methyltransferase
MPISAVNRRAFQGGFFGGLSEEECRQLHWASLEILEHTGVRLYHQEAIDLSRRGGADVSDGNLVRFPPGMAEKAFTTAPRRVVLCDRHGRRVMPVEDYNCFYGPGSDTLNIVDHRDNVRRKPLLRDVEEGVKLCDALPNIDFCMSMVLPSDVNQAIADRYQMEIMLSGTSKPIVFVSYDLAGCVDAVEMAEEVVGGADALRRNPLAVCYINVTTGLRHNQEALEKLLYLSGKGLPSIYVPVETGGATSPVTAAAEIALVNAGALVGLILSQLHREGAPFIMPGWGSAFLDMRTLVTHYAEPLHHTMAQALAHFYGLPMFSLGGASDSQVVDQQAAAEAALTILTNTLGGGNIIHDLGYLEAGLTFSLVQLAICEEIVGWVKAFVRGEEINDETLALDWIHQAGPDGEFLDSEHTLSHYKERYYPDLLDRSNHDAWAEGGGKTLAQRASEKVTDILDVHQPEPLPAAIRSRLREIVQRAEAQAG